MAEENINPVLLIVSIATAEAPPKQSNPRPQKEIFVRQNVPLIAFLLLTGLKEARYHRHSARLPRNCGMGRGN